MLHNYVLTEFLKLRRSLALLLVVAAPSCVLFLNLLMAVGRDGPADMALYGLTAAALWAFAMLPLSVTALAVLLAQIEHGPRTWDHVLILPGARPRLYLAKAIVMMVLVAAMTGLLLAATLAAAPLVERLDASTGRLDRAALVVAMIRMIAAAGLVSMLQLWVALHFRSFVPPLVLGIAGTFVAVAATSAKQGLYFPWLMAVNVLSADPESSRFAVLLGGIGGLVALGAMLVHLSRREA